jgi:hypothetical protein
LSPGRDRTFLSSPERPTPPPIQWVLAGLFPGIKRPEPDANHPPPSSAEVKNKWRYSSLLSYAFIARRATAVLLYMYSCDVHGLPLQRSKPAYQQFHGAVYRTVFRCVPSRHLAVTWSLPPEVGSRQVASSWSRFDLHPACNGFAS